MQLLSTPVDLHPLRKRRPVRDDPVVGTAQVPQGGGQGCRRVGRAMQRVDRLSDERWGRVVLGAVLNHVLVVPRVGAVNFRDSPPKVDGHQGEVGACRAEEGGGHNVVCRHELHPRGGGGGGAFLPCDPCVLDEVHGGCCTRPEQLREDDAGHEFQDEAHRWAADHTRVRIPTHGRLDREGGGDAALGVEGHDGGVLAEHVVHGVEGMPVAEHVVHGHSQREPVRWSLGVKQQRHLEQWLVPPDAVVPQLDEQPRGREGFGNVLVWHPTADGRPPLPRALHPKEHGRQRVSLHRCVLVVQQHRLSPIRSVQAAVEPRICNQHLSQAAPDPRTRVLPAAVEEGDGADRPRRRGGHHHGARLDGQELELCLSTPQVLPLGSSLPATLQPQPDHSSRPARPRSDQEHLHLSRHRSNGEETLYRQ
mmetsp:Transcript_55430/g.131635  ORF Transcript_55430/g.131635 Transcript_55430/m.131635 type:complete len:421 (-) Transcript_55430:85-1347(-)